MVQIQVSGGGPNATYTHIQMYMCMHIYIYIDTYVICLHDTARCRSWKSGSLQEPVAAEDRLRVPECLELSGPSFLGA